MLPLPTRLYLEYTRFLRRYHRFSAEGAERLLDPGAKLVVAYHGRGLPMDLGILSLFIFEQRGYLPRSITHEAMYKLGFARAFFNLWGGLPGDGPEVAEAVARGETVFLAPGGTREALRTFRDRYKVDWGKRRGYLKLALKYGMPIVPVASSGVDDRFIGLNDGHAWGRKLKMPGGAPFWIGLGIGVFPLALPLPSKIHTIVGEPIDLQTVLGVPPTEPEHFEELHRLVTGKVQELLDRARYRDAK
jgi:1-acyl-sn-glycerol-3-phosphate acyltransferase